MRRPLKPFREGINGGFTDSLDLVYVPDFYLVKTYMGKRKTLLCLRNNCVPFFNQSLFSLERTNAQAITLSPTLFVFKCLFSEGGG